MTAYKDLFSSWADVVREFSAPESEAVEPDEVVLAEYSYEDYSGSAEVIYRRGDKWYWNSGSHCSCWGLEDQWQPVEYESGELLAAALDRGYNATAYAPVIARLRGTDKDEQS